MNQEEAHRRYAAGYADPTRPYKIRIESLESQLLAKDTEIERLRESLGKWAGYVINDAMELYKETVHTHGKDDVIAVEIRGWLEKINTALTRTQSTGEAASAPDPPIYGETRRNV